MSLVVKTKDASQLMDTDLDELASMGGSFGIGAISKAKEDTQCMLPTRKE